ncbi:MAG TPA: DUF4157 domain-containing protein [Burkholderiaceae bacterium]
MTFAIAQATTNNGVATTFLPPDLRQLVNDVARLVTSDPGAAAQLVRELMPSLPDASNRELASSVTAGLDDHALHGLSQTPPGRDLLNVLGSHPHDQLGRIRDALYSVAHNSAGWVNQVAQQIAHPGLRNAGSSGNTTRSDAANKEQVTNAFEEQFAAKATNKQEFDAFMQQVFGNKYDKATAEQFRQQALAGDFSFLPEVKFVDANTLGGANGAYNAEEGVVYINKDMAASDPAKAAQTFVEEAGHHLDAQLNTVDTQGDEGEMFRRVLGGEQLSAQQVADIRNENDKGTITVDGKEVQVEFWNPFKAIGDAAKAVGGAIVDGAKAVGGAIVDGAKAVGGAIVDGAKAVGGAIADVGKGIWNGVKDVASGVWGAVKNVGHGLYDMTAGFLMNLVQGNISEALNSVVRGFDRAVFQSTARLYSGVLDGLQSVTNGITDALGPIGKPLRWVTDRAFDIGHTVLDTTVGITRDLFRMIPDTVNGFVGDMERAIKLAADGRWGDAAKQFGMAFVNVPGHLLGSATGIVMRALQGVASIAQTAVGAEPPARKLTGEERAYLESIYGDSIDYDMIRVKQGGPLNNAMAPHTVGNTVYMPDDQFDKNGKLTPDGLETLGHEVAHVWQNQNGGGDYIGNALGAQAWAWITGGDRNGAYDWKAALADGESFESMNDEQRAKAMEDIGIALKNDGQITEGDGLTAAQVAFLKDTAEKVQAGEGAG